MVQNYVWRLRKVLADGGDAEIVTRGRGYELQIDRELIDALRFERLVGEATRGASGDARARRWRCSAASRSPTSPRSRSPARRSAGWRSCG